MAAFAHATRAVLMQSLDGLQVITSDLGVDYPLQNVVVGAVLVFAVHSDSTPIHARSYAAVPNRVKQTMDN